MLCVSSKIYDETICLFNKFFESNVLAGKKERFHQTDSTSNKKMKKSRSEHDSNDYYMIVC